MLAELQNKLLIASAMMDVINADFCVLQDDFEKASCLYEKATKVLRKMEGLPSEFSFSLLLNKYAILQSRRYCYEEALALFEEAMAVSAKNADILTLISAMGNSAIIYTVIGRPEMALAAWQKCLSISRQIGDEQGEEIALIHIKELTQ